VVALSREESEVFWALSEHVEQLRHPLPGQRKRHTKDEDKVIESFEQVMTRMLVRLSPEQRVALDVGASTGGFSQVLLERGATRVYALDVGHGQLHPKIKGDRRVIQLEGLNARDLRREHVPESPHVIVADVSFISLKQALPPALSLAARDAWAVFLVKPQFELGPRGTKGGIVKDDAARASAVNEISAFVKAQGWQVLGSIESPIPGGDGNR